MKNLILAYEEAAENLASAFIEKYYGTDATEVGWVSGEIGGGLIINDDYWSFGNIVTALRFKISRKILFDWNDRATDAAITGKTFMNLQTYAKIKKNGKPSDCKHQP